MIHNDAVSYLRDAGDHPLMYSFPDGAVFAFDRDLRFLSAGGLGLADIGLSRDMLEGRTIFEAFSARTAAAVEPFYRAAFDGATTSMSFPYEGRTYVQRIAPVRDRDGNVVAGLGFTHDVSEALAAENALRESEERNRLTLEHAPIGMALVELGGKWRHVNSAITKLLGYTEVQLLDMTFQEITHPDDLDLDLEHLGRLIAGEIDSYQIEKRYLTSAGSTVWALLSVSLVHDDESAPLYFISQVQDISDRKRQQQALQDVTAMLAHDLRTPLTVIRGFAELVEGSAEADLSEVRKQASRIVASARTMTQLLENALTATTLDAGEVVANPKIVSLRTLASDVIDSVGLTDLSVDLTGVGEIDISVDPTHLAQVLTNLLTNAAKYGGDAVAISATATSDRVLVSITDNGRGVEPGFVPHLFDRFTRSSGARHGRQHGSGLGLFIVQDLLAANGGSIHYEPSTSGGARFVLALRPA